MTRRLHDRSWKRASIALVTSGVAGLLCLVILPRWIDGTPAMRLPTHGRLIERTIAYRDTAVADVLLDIARSTDFRAVAMPAIAERRFSGSIPFDRDGQRMADALAKRIGCDLRHAGPHWVLSD